MFSNYSYLSKPKYKIKFLNKKKEPEGSYFAYAFAIFAPIRELL